MVRYLSRREQKSLELSLELFEALVAKVAEHCPTWGGFGLAMQAYQTRSLDLIAHITALARRYKVAPEPVSRLVQEAWTVGHRVGLDPTLILAIMAVESSFNPFAESAVGAQGLMQVMTRVHTDKYQNFGGHFAAFDPVSNLRVGVKVLQECIARAGSLEGGLKFYVGAAHVEDDGGYVGKVLAEHQRLLQVAGGRTVPIGGGAVIPTSLPVADLDTRPASPNS